MMKFLDSKKFRVLISLCVLLVVGIITTVVSFSNTYDWVETDIDKLYKSLLTQNDELINSNIYLVTDEFITRIEPNTTIEEFTANINRDDFILTFNNVKVNEGLVKTGMVLTRGEEHYTLVVAGDLNKDGLMNYIDISMMIDNTKSQPADKIIRLANDFNEDGHYDKTDVDNAVDYVLNGKIELKEVNTDVRAASLEIVSGDLGDNNWYLGDIVVEIKNNDATDTAYKVIGTSIQEGIGISDETEVTLSGYGAYKVIAWNYNEDGVRSNVTTMTFKIDDREIVPTVTYSTTEPTSKKVVATISFNKENVVVTNNNRNNEYTFYKNDNFQFQYRDVTGRVGRTTAMVSWMEDAVGADGQWRYTLVDDDEIYLREYLGDDILTMGNDGGVDFSIPVEYDGYKVYGVGNNVNDYNIFGMSVAEIESLTNYQGIKMNKLIIPDGIKEIGDSAFSSVIQYADGLVIPDSVVRIGWGAFNNSDISASNKGSLTLGENLEYIDAAAFWYNNFSGDLIIPKGVKEIGDSAFGSNSFTGKLRLNDKLESIGFGAFSENRFTGDLVIPESVKSIGMAAFNANNFTGQLVINAKLKTIEVGTFAGNSFTGTLVIPDTVETIGRDAFSYNYFIGNLVIPDSVIKIDENAFYHSGSYSSLVLSKNLQVIGPFAFSQSVISGSLVIPNKVTSVGMCAFDYSGFTGDLIIGDSVKTIEYNAFGYNEFAEDLTIGDSLTNLDWISESGLDLSKFTGSLTIGNTITEIPSFFFENSGFTGDLIIGDGVTNIGTDAFANTSFAGTLSLGSGLKTISENAFGNNAFTGSLIIPNSVETIYDNAFTDNKFTGDLIIPSSVKYIGSNAFFNNSFSGDLVIPKNVNHIGACAFMYNNFTGTLTIENGVREIGAYAFADNRFTGGLKIPDSVTHIYEGAFAVTTFSGNFELIGSLDYLGNYAVSGSQNLIGTVYYSQVGSYDGNPFENSSIGFFDDTMYG